MNERFRVLITSPWFTERHLRKLESEFDVDSNTMDRWFTEEELAGMIENYDAVIAGLDPFPASVLEHAHRLKIIARRGIGFDKIDLEECRRRGITVTNTPIPDEHTAVAEFTLGLILDVTRNISGSSNSLKKGSWERAGFLGDGLKNITVGVLGLGNIGSRVAGLLKSLGTSVIYTDPAVDSSSYRKVGIEELFRESDVVTVHVPRTAETEGFVNRKLLGLMKKGSRFINTARAEVVNTKDLMEYVRNGTLSSVALDVFGVEPPHSDELMEDPRVITTPHIAAYTRKSFDSIDEICCNNVRSVLLGLSRPLNVVN